MRSKNQGSLIGALIAVGIAVCNFACGGGSPPPPISVTAFSSAQTLDEGRSATITATVVNDTSGKGVTWRLLSKACLGTGLTCGTLSNQTATSVTYTAPGSPMFAFNVQVVARMAKKLVRGRP